MTQQTKQHYTQQHTETQNAEQQQGNMISRLPKRIRIYIMVALCLVLATVAFANDIKSVTIKFITPITVGETTTVKGNFTNLTAKARSMGLDNFVVIGKLTSGSPQNGKRTHRINWHTVQQDTANGKQSLALSPQLQSDFRTNAKLKVIKPNTNIIAKGDLNGVIVAIQRIKQEQDKAQKVSVENPNDIKLKQQPQARKNYDGGESGSGGSSVGSTGGDLAKKPNTDKEQVKSCADRVDFEIMKAFVQERKATVDANGNEKDKGRCIDTGKKYDMEKRYGGACTPLADLTKDKVYQAYRIYYNNGKQEIMSKDCTRDMKDKVLNIITTANGCSTQLNFNSMKATKQIRKYYTLDGVVHTVKACHASTTVWDILEKNCQWVYDRANDMAIKHTKLVYTDDNNHEQKARACTAKTGKGSTVPIVEEFADKTFVQNYINDFSAKTSWLKSRKYYDKDGAKVYVTNWDKGTKTYNHTNEDSGCNIEHDDDNLKSRQLHKTQITVDGKKYDIKSCSGDGAKWINYRHLGLVWTPTKIEKNALIYGKYTIKNTTNKSESVSISLVVTNRNTQWACESNRISGNYIDVIRIPKNYTINYQLHTFKRELLINNSTALYTQNDTYTNPSSITKSISGNVGSSTIPCPSGYSYKRISITDRYRTFTGTYNLKANPSPSYSNSIGNAISWIGGGSVDLTDKNNYTTGSKLLGRTNVITYTKKEKYRRLGNSIHYILPVDSNGNDVIHTKVRLDGNANPTDI